MTASVDGVPELGVLLGRLASPVPRGPAVLPLDEIRFDLLGALYARAGLARREIAAGHPDAARHHLSREAWIAAWREASGHAAARLVETIDRQFANAAAESRMPGRTLAQRTPSDEDRAVIRNRAAAAGIPLEEIPPPEQAFEWAAGLLRAAMALDESWERLERVIEEELAACQGEVKRVRQWRRPMVPLWIGTALAVALALWLGLSLGGYVPAPGPLGTLQAWFWSLPWP
jgi:hypothetical protein